MSKYRVGDIVRVLHTDYKDTINEGDCRVVSEADDDGIHLPSNCGNLYFFDWEVEHVNEVKTQGAELDGIISKLERIKALRKELGLTSA